jgi:LmbE family N-acetylglucosaminyl deacetylase
MATLVFFHAHPDDESIATGGSMRRAADEGHRVVLVLATMGEHGEVAEGFLDAAETLGERRLVETQRSAEILGVSVVEFLGYVDSGMMDTPQNDGEGSFWRADVEEAAQRLATILERESADVLTVYDDNGNYGHPDHIQVHRVGVRAAAMAGVTEVFESTVNRDEMLRHFAELSANGEVGGDDAPTTEELEALGVAEALPPTASTCGPTSRPSATPCGPTPARSARRASSSRCPTMRSPGRSAPSGTSAPGSPPRSPSSAPGCSTTDAPVSVASTHG